MQTSDAARPPLHEVEVNIFELWSVVRRGWLLLVVATLVGTALGYVASVAIPDRYKAEALIAEVGGNRQASTAMIDPFGGLVALAGLDTRGARDRNNPALTIVKSRSFSEEFIRRHDLMPILYPDNPNPPPLWQAARRFSNTFEVTASRFVPGTLVMSVEWEDPELAAQWANDLVVLANDIARRRDITQAERSVEYINEKMAETNIVELQRTLYGLLEAEQKTLMLAHAREDYAFEIIDPAIVPVSPSFPNRVQMLAAGIAAGFMVGFLILCIIALLRHWRQVAGNEI